MEASLEFPIHFLKIYSGDGMSRKNIAERLSSAGLNPQEDAVRKAILTAFAATGKAPAVQDLARTLSLSRASVLAICRTLAAADLIVWQDDTRHISSAPIHSRGARRPMRCCLQGT